MARSGVTEDSQTVAGGVSVELNRHLQEDEELQTASFDLEFSVQSQNATPRSGARERLSTTISLVMVMLGTAIVLVIVLV
jgi:hypothetical protein